MWQNESVLKRMTERVCYHHFGYFKLLISGCFTSRFYPGVADALRFASSRVYIVTTKQVLPSLSLLLAYEDNNPKNT